MHCRSTLSTCPHLITAIIVTTVVLLLVTTASAIQPKRWTHTTEADFDPGEREQTVVTNHGDIKLATDSRVLNEITEQLAEDVSIVYDVRAIDKTHYLAAGPVGRLLAFADDKLSEIATLEDEQIFALEIYDGKLLIAISGTNSRLAALADGKLETLIDLPDVRYVWDVVVDGKKIYLATGNEGKVLRINMDAEGEPGIDVLLEAAQKNIFCIGRDKQGRIYAGTDTDGLVYRISFNEQGEAQPFVLYDAAEPEIGALLVKEDGTVFAGTADANQARPGRMKAAAKEEKGRPEAGPADTTPQPPKIPNLPPKPDPKPTEPDPKTSPQTTPASDPKTDPATTDTPDTQPDAGAEPAPAGDTPDQPDASPKPDPAPTTPTPEQRDELRETIRKRLLDARESGEMQVAPPSGGPSSRSPASARTAPPRRSTSQPAKGGNAIYRIDTDGFVSEVFRESVMILRIADHGDRLYVATGNEGQLFRVDPDEQEKAELVDLEPQQLTALLLTEGDNPEAGDPRILLGTSNPAQLVQLDTTVAAAGSYTSKALDAAQVSLWGKLNVTAELPKGTAVKVQTRSGNVQDPEDAPWAEWSDAFELKADPDTHALQPRPVKVTSPPGRFIQYRLTLAGDGKVTPVVDKVDLAYVMPNLPPVVESLKAAYPAARPGTKDAAPPTKINVEWKAKDPNGDSLRYTVEYRPGGSDRWLTLAEDVETTKHEWETRKAPDGWYAVRVLASDAAANVPETARVTARRSDPVLVDNTPPVLKTAIHRPEKPGDIRVNLTATDAFSTIKAVGYTMDGDKIWQPALPEDLIYDSTSESLVITISGLSPGPHVLTLRATDTRGNARYENVLLEVDAAADDKP